MRKGIPAFATEDLHDEMSDAVVRFDTGGRTERGKRALFARFAALEREGLHTTLRTGTRISGPHDDRLLRPVRVEVLSGEHTGTEWWITADAFRRVRGAR